MPRNKLLSCASALLLASSMLGASGALAQPAAPDRPARAFAPSQPVPDRYIVVFRAHVAQPAQEAARLVAAAGPGSQLHHSYANAIRGFAATLPAAAVQALQGNPNVASIEQDQTVSLSEVQVQAQATWGLDRIDQRDRPLSSTYEYGQTGSGVHAFIIDTGIRGDHSEFAGRLLAGYTSISDGRGTEDCDGHGTHVAGTVGGTTWGVAKQVKLIPVRVLDCRGSGTWSGVIAGVDWVAGSTLRPAVANMSLGGGKSSSVNSAVAGAVAKGVTMVVAAGNSTADACNYSPASEPSALTIGATTSSDARASYSNYGTCLDLFAPGSSITSAWYSSATASSTLSGTSMASPHVAGVTALVLQGNPTASPAAVTQAVLDHATTGKVGSAGSGSPNLLAYSAPGASSPVTEPAERQVAVGDILGSSKSLGKNQWRASARVTVYEPPNPISVTVSGATVTGSFDGGSSGSCVTGTDGSCELTSNFKVNVNQTTFRIGGVSGTGMVYDSGQNMENTEGISR